MINIQKIGQIAVPVHDLTRAVRFYKETLGLPLLFQMETMAFFDCQGIRLLLSIPEDERYDHASSIIYFHVEDIQKAYFDLKSNGVELLDEPHVIAKMNGIETWLVFFKDTEGNIHALTSEVLV